MPEERFYFSTSEESPPKSACHGRRALCRNATLPRHPLSGATLPPSQAPSAPTRPEGAPRTACSAPTPLLLSQREPRGAGWPGGSVVLGQLGRRHRSLQPDPLVPHVLVVARAVLAAWQLRAGKRVTGGCQGPSPAPPLGPSPRGSFRRGRYKRRPTPVPLSPAGGWQVALRAEGGATAAGGGGDASACLSSPCLARGTLPQVGGGGRGAGHTQWQTGHFPQPGGLPGQGPQAGRSRSWRGPCSEARGSCVGQGTFQHGLCQGRSETKHCFLSHTLQQPWPNSRPVHTTRTAAATL